MLLATIRLFMYYCICSWTSAWSAGGALFYDSINRSSTSNSKHANDNTDDNDNATTDTTTTTTTTNNDTNKDIQHIQYLHSWLVVHGPLRGRGALAKCTISVIIHVIHMTIVML